MLSSHKDLARKLETLERKYDAQFKIVFDAIRQLMAPSRRRTVVASASILVSPRPLDGEGHCCRRAIGVSV